MKRTIDNITVVLICFSNFKKKLFPREKNKKITDENYATLNTTNNTTVITEPNNTFFSGIPSKISSKTEENCEKMIGEKNKTNKFNPFLNNNINSAPKTKTEGNGVKNLMNPAFNFKSSKNDFSKSKTNEYEKFEIKKDILNGKISLKD